MFGLLWLPSPSVSQTLSWPLGAVSNGAFGSAPALGCSKGPMRATQGCLPVSLREEAPTHAVAAPKLYLWKCSRSAHSRILNGLCDRLVPKGTVCVSFVLRRQALRREGSPIAQGRGANRILYLTTFLGTSFVILIVVS